MPSAGYTLDTIEELLDIPSADRTDGMSFLLRDFEDWFIFDAASTASDDGLRVWTPMEGSGKWHRCGGSMGYEERDSVIITGGSIDGIDPIAIASGGTGADNASDAFTNLGGGTLGRQNANAVAITGGSISGITALPIASGGTGASTATAAFTNLGGGTLGRQNANAVAITGGSISGITALPIASGGTGASTATAAFTNLGGGTLGRQNANAVAITGGSISGITALPIASGGTGADNALDAVKNLGVYLPGYNYVINGDFQSALAGTSFTVAGRIIEMWSAAFGTNGVATVSQQAFTLGQTSVPSEPTYYLRWAQTTGGTGTNPELQAQIEDVRTLAGQQATVSFWARAASALSVSFSIQQSFGTGGSPSANVNTTSSTFSVTTTWQKFTYTITLPSIAGKTLGTDANSSCLRLRWLLPLGSTFTFEIADLKLEEGSRDTPFRRVDDAFRISRYYQSLRLSARFWATASGQFMEVPIPYQQLMRGIPAATLISSNQRANLSTSLGISLPAVFTLDNAGGRFFICSAAAGDCYALVETLILDARI